MALTKTYTIDINGEKADATVGQLKGRVSELETAMEGAKELEEMMLELGKAKGALKELEDAMDTLDPQAQASAYP